MGYVKGETKVWFPNGHVWILWDAGEENEYGYEIDVTGEDGFEGMLGGIANWSFGYEDWSEDMWLKWGEYVSKRFSAIEGDEKKLMELIEELDKIECSYMLYQNESDGTEHLRDLDYMAQLIA